VGARNYKRHRKVSAARGPGSETGRLADANTEHLVGHTRRALHVVLEDLHELEIVISRLKAWLAVPAEFRRT